MRRLDNQRSGGRDSALERCRLETPPMAGYRPGMSSSSIIGRKLGTLYIVPDDRRVDIEAALQTLDDKLT